MATQEKTWNVANRLHSQKDSDNPEVNHIIAGADEIYDDAKGAKQSDINAQADAALADRYTKTETYSKEQLDSLITTPDVNYVSVVATNATTAVTDILPATGEANTIYRVGNWDGTQYDSTMYALYAWNGSAYVCLAVRSSVGEVYDVSVNHPDGQGNPTPYANLTAAIGTDGANIPADIRRGGMSIKFIQGNAQSSDNKYVQYRLMGTSFSTDVNDWQGVDDEPTAGSENLVTSGGVNRLVYNTIYLTPSEFKTYLPAREGSGVNGSDIGCKAYTYSVSGVNKKIIINTSFNGTDNVQYSNVAYFAIYDNRMTLLYASEVITNPKPSVLECDLSLYPTATTLKVTAPTPVGSVTYAKVYYSEEKYLRKEKDDEYVKIIDIVDSLESDETTKPLSAKQGKVLKQHIDSTGNDIESIEHDIESITNDVTEINEELESITKYDYEWRENAPIDTYYYGAGVVSGRGNVIASNSTIYKVIVNIGNFDTVHPITQVKMQLRKDVVNGELLATKVVNFGFSDTDFHDLEFDFSENPISYTGEIYCTLQCNSTYPKFSIIAASAYIYSAVQTYTTSADFDTPAWIETSASSALKILYAKLAYDKNIFLSIDTENIADKAVTEEKLSEEVQEKLNTPSGNERIKVNLPSEIVVAAGSCLQLFYRGIISAVNPYNYNIEVICIDRSTSKTAGLALPRYFQLTVNDYCNIHRYTEQPLPTGSDAVELNYPLVNTDGNYFVKDVTTTNAAETIRIQTLLESMSNGSKPILYIQEGSSYTTWKIERRNGNANAVFDLTINVRDNSNNIISTATSVIRTIPVPKSPVSQKNILVFGASVVSKGYICNELRRRLTLTSGSLITPIEPIGLGLSNINFIGRKTGSTVTDVHQEATGGWSWGTYATPGTPRYRFYVTDGSGENVGVDETFTIAGLTFTVKEKNITDGDGNFSCTYTGTQSGDVPATGSITFQGGVVNYSSRVAETTNPFWNPNKASGAGIDFKFYADTYCNGNTIDVLVSHCGVNDMAGNTWNKDTTINSIKAVARAYKEYCNTYNVNGKFIISSIAVPDPTGGFGINYFATGAMSNYYSALLKLFDLATIFEDISKDEEFSSFVTYAPVMPESDGENMYPQTETNVNNRSTKKELVGQNAYHPEELGHKIIADSIYQSICDILQQ